MPSGPQASPQTTGPISPQRPAHPARARSQDHCGPRRACCLPVGGPAFSSLALYLLGMVSQVNVHKHRWFLWREIRDTWMTGVAEGGAGSAASWEGRGLEAPWCSDLGIHYPRVTTPWLCGAPGSGAGEASTAALAEGGEVWTPQHPRSPHIRSLMTQRDPPPLPAENQSLGEQARRELGGRCMPTCSPGLRLQAALRLVQTHTGPEGLGSVWWLPHVSAPQAPWFSPESAPVVAPRSTPGEVFLGVEGTPELPDMGPGPLV